MTLVKRGRGDIAGGVSLMSRDFYTKIQNNCLYGKMGNKDTYLTFLVCAV